MTDPEIARLAQQWDAKLDRAKHRTELKARTGKLTSATAINPNPVAGAQTNKIWVRIGATKANPAGRSQQQVWNYGKVSTRKADLAVIVDYNAVGDLCVVGADEQAADTSGVPSGFYTGDPLPPELSDIALPLANLIDLKPYVAGGLSLRAKPGLLPGGAYWPDVDVKDLTADVTATSGMTAYVVAGIDLSTGAWVIDTAADHPLMLPWPANAADIETVLAGWTNTFPVAAIPLANGATAFTNSDIVDLRGWSISGASDAYDVTYGMGNVGDALDADELVLTDHETRIDVLEAHPIITTASVGTTTYDIDWSVADTFEITLTGNPTFTFSNLVAGKSITLTLIQGSGGSHTVTWPGSVNWPNGTPTLLTTAGLLDQIVLNVLANGTMVEGFSATQQTVVNTATLYVEQVLYDNTLSGNGSWDVSSIDQTYERLKLRIWVRGTVSAIEDALYILFNNDTTVTNYRSIYLFGDGSTAGTGHADTPFLMSVLAATALADNLSYLEVELPEYTGNKHKIAQAVGVRRISATADRANVNAVWWESTSAINRIMIRTDNNPTDQFIAGSRLQITGFKAVTVVVP